MATPVNGVAGIGSERAAPAADMVAEARQRQADRLRAAQAESTSPTDVVEPTATSAATESEPRREAIPPYRVQLDPDTLRLSTEVLDTETGEVILRIPPTYVDPAYADPAHVDPRDALDVAPDPAGHREVEA